MVYEIDAVEDEITALSKVSIVDPDMNASRIVLLSVSLFRGNGNLLQYIRCQNSFPEFKRDCLKVLLAANRYCRHLRLSERKFFMVWKM